MQESDDFNSTFWDDSAFIDKEDYYERLGEGIGMNYHTVGIDNAVFDKAVREAVDEVIAKYTDEDGAIFIDDWDWFENEMYLLAVNKLHLEDD